MISRLHQTYMTARSNVSNGGGAPVSTSKTGTIGGMSLIFGGEHVR